MRLTTDPMIAVRLMATQRVNAFISSHASGLSHIERAHQAKLDAAKKFIAEGEASQLLTQEAELRGMELRHFAELIVAKAAEKGDALADRELYRQRVLKMITDARTPTEIDAILAEHAGMGEPTRVI